MSLRWVSDSYIVNEDLIGLVSVDKTDADTLVSVLKSTLIQYNLPISKCCGQAYDIASNMSGYISGVTARISREEPKAALYIHCLAHSIDLFLYTRLCKVMQMY